MDAYQKGLNGQQAAWAAKKYHGHRILSQSILGEFDATHSNQTTMTTILYTI
jgi:hypothetical protein